MRRRALVLGLDSEQEAAAEAEEEGDPFAAAAPVGEKVRCAETQIQALGFGADGDAPSPILVARPRRFHLRRFDDGPRAAVSVSLFIFQLLFIDIYISRLSLILKIKINA